MTNYRCVVFQSTGNYVPYAGGSIQAALDAFSQNLLADTVVVQEFKNHDWQTIVGVWR